MAFTRSATGCFACKSRHRKCDETKPHCLRCQKSRIECPGYMYVQDPNRPSRKPRTIPAPRTVVDRSRTTAIQGNSLASAEELGLQPQWQSTLNDNLATSGVPHDASDTSVIANVGPPLEDIGISNRLASSSNGSFWHSSVGLHTPHGLAVNTVNTGPLRIFPGVSTDTPMASGLATRSTAPFNLSPPMDPSLQCPQPIIDPNVSSVPTWPPPVTKRQDDAASHEKEDPEGVISAICRQPVLDRTAQSNALPFVLQAYVSWIGRSSLEPVKLVHIARDFVFSRFGDGEQSRFIIGLLANVGSRVGTVELAGARPNPMLTALQNAVRRRLEMASSYPNPIRSELATALDFALDTILIHFYVSPISDAIILREEAAPIFRRLCPEPPDAPVDLLLLLRHPLSSLGRFTQMDITFSVVTDMPTMFRYEVTIPEIQSSKAFESMLAIQGDGVVQWLHGIPNQLVLLFAKMISMRADGLTLSLEVTASIEREIRSIQPFDGSSSERFLAIMRIVVQECWKQVALVYLYMAVCGDPSGTPRVRETFRRFMALLNGVKPGRLPDEFLALPLVVISPAAQRKRDRKVIRRRILGLEKLRPNSNMTSIIEDYWARTDAEGREVTWSDVGISRRQVLNA